MLCQFQEYNKVIQLYTYVYLFFFRFFPHVCYYRLLSSVPCAIQQVLVDYLFYIQQLLLLLLSRFSRVRIFATQQTVAHKAPPSMGFSRCEYWSGLPCPPPGDLPDPGFEPASLVSPALAGGFFTSSATIIVINISREYNYMLCLVTPSSEHPNIVLWAPGTYSFGISALLYHYVTAFCCDIMNSLYVGLVSPPTRS